MAEPSRKTSAFCLRQDKRSASISITPSRNELPRSVDLINYLEKQQKPRVYGNARLFRAAMIWVSCGTSIFAQETLASGSNHQKVQTAYTSMYSKINRGGVSAIDRLAVV